MDHRGGQGHRLLLLRVVEIARILSMKRARVTGTTVKTGGHLTAMGAPVGPATRGSVVKEVRQHVSAIPDHCAKVLFSRKSQHVWCSRTGRRQIKGQGGSSMPFSTFFPTHVK